MSPSHFRDHFSGHSADYAAYRPGYPRELFEHILSFCSHRAVAWDCATGSGQVAVVLAREFGRVVATDASVPQLAHAQPAEGVVYCGSAAEAVALRDGCIDLATVGQALHWFEWDSFFTEVRRVLKPEGVVAAWGYGLGTLGPEFDATLRHFHDDIVGDFWPSQRVHIDEGYRRIPFPFEALPTGRFAMTARWNLTRLLAYLGTWSAVQRYRKEKSEDPLIHIEGGLAARWGDPQTERTFTWPLVLKLGRRGTEAVSS